MRIGLDVRYLSHGLVGGIHTYLKNLVPALLQEETRHEFFLYADTKRPFELTDLPEHVTLRLLPYHNPLSSIYYDFFMRQQMEKDNLDIAHFTASYGFGPRGSRTVITLQDEINVMPMSAIVQGHRKNIRTIAMMTYLHFCTRAALHRTDALITVSEYSKRQIIRYSNLDAGKIITIPHGCPTDIRHIEDPAVLTGVRQRLGLTRPYILAEAFKNPAVIMRAWKLIPRSLRDATEIVFFSRSQDVLPVVHQAIADGYARLFVRPTRHDLSALYSMSGAFVFPSWIEGFGIPLIEAMSCGAPVITSDRGSIPEVVGDAALIIDAEDEQTLAQHLVRILTDSSEAQQWRVRGYARAANYTWQKTARRMIDCYEQIAHGYQYATLQQT